MMAGGSIDGSITSDSNSADSQLVKDPPPFRFTWRIDRFSELNAEKLYSDVFEVGGYKWRVLMFPKGNNVNYLSMYLDVADSSSRPEGWTKFAQFSLAVVSQIHTKYSRIKDLQHQFNKHQSDWGFASFMSLNEFFDCSKGYLVNDVLIVEVEVTCDADEYDTADHLRERLKKKQEDICTTIEKSAQNMSDGFVQERLKKEQGDLCTIIEKSAQNMADGFVQERLKKKQADLCTIIEKSAQDLSDGFVQERLKKKQEDLCTINEKSAQDMPDGFVHIEKSAQNMPDGFVHIEKSAQNMPDGFVQERLTKEQEDLCTIIEKSAQNMPDGFVHIEKSAQDMPYGFVHIEKSAQNMPYGFVQERLKKELDDLSTIIKVVRDEDLAEQIGNDIYFDLVDHDKVKSFRVPKDTSFKIFKEEVAKKLGIPAQFQRFWLWTKRQNNTYRPLRPLTQLEEARPVGQLRKVKKVEEADLKLFLEVECGLDLRPTAPLKKRCDDILLFFKLYNPEKEELRYVGRLFVDSSSKPSEILTRLNKLAGYDPDEEIELYEEIKFKPNVMCIPVDKNLTFLESQLENGDIICFQKASAMDNEKLIRNPDVPSYLKYMHNLQFPFSPSAKQSAQSESLEEQNNNIIAEETNVDKSTQSESLEEQNNNTIAEETNVDKNTEAQQSKLKIETTHDEEGTCKGNAKFVSVELEKINAMIDENVIAAIDRVLSEGITISIQSQPSVQGQEASRAYPNLPEQLLQELRDVVFKEDLVERFKKGLNLQVNFSSVMEKIDACADFFSSHQLEQVGVVKNLFNNFVRIFEKTENLKKKQDLAKKSTDEGNEALKKTREKILTSQTSFTNHQTQLNSLDAHIADLKSKLEKLQGDRANIAEIQDQEKDNITSLNKEVKSIFHRLVDDHIELKTVEDKIPEAQTELENYEKLYGFMKAAPPF